MSPVTNLGFFFLSEHKINKKEINSIIGDLNYGLGDKQMTQTNFAIESLLILMQIYL